MDRVPTHPNGHHLHQPSINSGNVTSMIIVKIVRNRQIKLEKTIRVISEESNFAKQNTPEEETMINAK